MLKVLLADDEPASSEIIRHYILHHSLPLEIVGETYSGDDTIEAIISLKPNLVFIDIQMPVFNGLQVMDEINQRYSGDISFIIITAYAFFEYAQKGIQLGAKDLLLKPVLYNQFADSLMRVLGYRYTDNPIFNSLLEFVHSHYAEELTLHKCAESLGMTPSNIVKLFKLHLDTSLIQYCNNLRVKKSCEEMKKGVPIKEAAVLTGFNNLNYFYRTFKKIMNSTPGEFLSNIKNNKP